LIEKTWSFAKIKSFNKKMNTTKFVSSVVRQDEEGQKVAWDCKGHIMEK